MLHAVITAYNENNYRLANQAKRPIRMSWTLRAWSAPSFSQRGNDQKQKYLSGIIRTCVVSCHFITSCVSHVLHRSVNTVQVLTHTFSAVQPQSEMNGSRPYPARSVTTPERRSVSYLANLSKRSDNNLNHIHFLFTVSEPVLWWQQHKQVYFILCAWQMSFKHSFLISGRAGWLWGWSSFGIQSPYMDSWPTDHHVYDLHLWVHPNMEATPLSCMWKGEVTKWLDFLKKQI